MGIRGPAPTIQKKIMARLQRRPSGMTTKEIQAAFGFGTIQAAQQAVKRLEAKGLVERSHEVRKVEGPFGKYNRSLLVFHAIEGKTAADV